MKKQILFLCTHNSARSQLAEALTNHLLSDKWKAFSAGTEKTAVKPETITVLEELQITTSNLYSKTLEQFYYETFDLVVTVCDSAKEACPVFPHGKEHVHVSFEDPSDYDEKVRLQQFRKTRDKIKKWILENLSNNE